MTWMQNISPFRDQFAYLGIAGCVLLCLCVLVAALGYRGKRQERYSLFNHFISELGERGVSARAWVFNAGMILSGLLMLPFVLGLGALLPGIWGFLGTVAGVVTAFSSMAVGLFPMNRITAHVRAAMSFFRAGLIMLVMFSFAILVQPPEAILVPRWSLVFSLLAAISYGTFLYMVRGGSALDQVGDQALVEVPPERPRFSALTTVEWAIFFSTIFWLLAMALVVM